MTLSDYLSKEGLTDLEFARKIGLTKHAIRKYKRGERTPRRETVILIKKMTRGMVPEAEWYK